MRKVIAIFLTLAFLVPYFPVTAGAQDLGKIALSSDEIAAFQGLDDSTTEVISAGDAALGLGVMMLVILVGAILLSDLLAGD